MPNQREIAQAAGLTQGTVSLALRGSRLISEETRRLVQTTARKLGYRPDPLVTTLMERIRSGRTVENHGCIAVVVDDESEKKWLRAFPHVYREQHQGIIRQATKRGFRIECFFLRGPGMSAEAINRQLHARGITGVILAAPQFLTPNPPILHWDRYALSTISYSWNTPDIDRVSSHHRHNMDHIFGEVTRRGYRRIGLCLPTNAVGGVDSNWMAGYLVGQSHLPRSCRLPLFVGTVHDKSTDSFHAWYERWRPDVLITLFGEERLWLESLGHTFAEVGLVCLNCPPKSDLSGMDENNVEVGATACDLVVNQITHNERGLPSTPKLILIRGKWKEGVSLPGKPHARCG
jgi:LacI family transcriptional regulator